MLASSLPEFLEPDICREVLPDADVPGILERLRKRHLFLSPLESRTQYFAYDPLFRDFLARKLIVEKGASVRRELDAPTGAPSPSAERSPRRSRTESPPKTTPACSSCCASRAMRCLRAGTVAAVIDAARFLEARRVKAAIVGNLLGEAARSPATIPAAAAQFERALDARTAEGSPELAGRERANALQGSRTR
jgi:hypothetical protein